MSGAQLMVVLIVAMVMVAMVLKARMQRPGFDSEPSDTAEARQLRQEVRELKERIQVLERIATDRENSLERQIEELRDR